MKLYQIVATFWSSRLMFFFCRKRSVGSFSFLGAVEFMLQFQSDCSQTIVSNIAVLLQDLLKPKSKSAQETSKLVCLPYRGIANGMPATQNALQSDRRREDEPVREVVAERQQYKAQNCQISPDCQFKSKPWSLKMEIPKRSEPLKEASDRDFFLEDRCDNI
jgi:hypothetical protein